MYSNDMTRAAERLERDLKTLSKKGGVKLANEVSDLRQDLNTFLEAVDDVLREKAEQEEAEEAAAQEARCDYDLRHRLLVGLAEEMTPFARKRPDSPCNVFKLRQVNQVLLPLKDELEAFLGETLSLADEDAALTYSDVSILLRGYVNLSTVYARRCYDLRYDENGK